MSNYGEDLEAVKREGEIMIELNHLVGKNHQFLCEEAILNLAALYNLQLPLPINEETLGN